MYKPKFPFKVVTISFMILIVILFILIIIYIRREEKIITVIDKYPAEGFIVTNVDGLKVEDYILKFKDVSLKDLMQTIRSYYDIPVVYKGRMPEGEYSITIDPTVSIGRLIDMLKGRGVKVNFDGEKIIVNN